MGQAIFAVIITAIILAIVVYCYLPHGGDRIYMCPKCGMRFTRAPRPAAIHFFDFILITCPYCGIASMMRRLRG